MIGSSTHRKYKGKKSSTYWCCNNRDRNSLCSSKIKVDLFGTVLDVQGEHHGSCHFKQESSRTALGYLPLNPEDCNKIEMLDLTDMMLAKAQEIATKDLSLGPKIIHSMVLQETKMNHQIFKGASDQKIINKVRNCRSKLNGNDVFRTIKMDAVARVKNSNNFFAF